MKDELIRKLCIILDKRDLLDDVIKAEFTIALDGYEVTEKCTEVAMYEYEGYNEEMIKRFLIAKTVAGLTSRTISFYRNQLFFTFDRINKPINAITSDDIKLYLAKRQLQDHLTSASLGNEYRVLGSFYGWLHREELIDKNPMFKVEKPKHRKQKKKAFSEMECELLREGCETLRDKAIIEILFSTWCRVSEVYQMDIMDIENDEITVIGKGKKERIVYLNSKAQLAIKNYLDSRTDSNPALFVSYDKPYDRLGVSTYEKMIRELGKKLNIPNAHPHRFRRTGATMALRGGMPIETVSHLLGHESLETTQIYLDVDEQDMKLAHKKYV